MLLFSLSNLYFKEYHLFICTFSQVSRQSLKLRLRFWIYIHLFKRQDKYIFSKRPREDKSSQYLDDLQEVLWDFAVCGERRSVNAVRTQHIRSVLMRAFAQSSIDRSGSPLVRRRKETRRMCGIYERWLNELQGMHCRALPPGREK